MLESWISGEEPHYVEKLPAEKIEANPSEPRYVHTKWGVGYYFQQT